MVKKIFIRGGEHSCLPELRDKNADKSIAEIFILAVVI